MSPGFSAADFDKSVGVSGGDGFSFCHQPSSFLDNKPDESLFDFDSFADSPVSLVDTTQSLFDSSFASHDPITLPFESTDYYDANPFDLQTDSGATNMVSDESVLAAEM